MTTLAAVRTLATETLAPIALGNDEWKAALAGTLKRAAKVGLTTAKVQAEMAVDTFGRGAHRLVGRVRDGL